MANSPSNIHLSPYTAVQTASEEQRTAVSSQDARQGRGGNTTVYVLAASILLLLLAYAIFGIFSDALLVSDLPPALDVEAGLPGPSPAQEAIIEQR